MFAITDVADMKMWLRNKGVKAEYITPDWEEPYFLVTNCGLYEPKSVAETIRRHGYNVEIAQ